ncbi:pitrilysin family protein [Flavobacteriaceae bacterium]|jgi:predicted Zn-dependent peptidase|nr:pitrilysin family protein [Flavobacteriaceae bacterium]|tara:strand:- start:843 stop:2147 length:1305 start_codon:yes stop_codon:yes gene_type:complete
MNIKLLYFFTVFLSINSFSQSVEYEKYTLNNGLDVILHKDNSSPVITTAVMYHIGAKDENPEKTGFAHFFEHLLFEGSKNIKRGQWDILVNSNGGRYNANTTADRTYYYVVFPSNNLELSLWLESERMLHPVINQIGIDTQKEVVKEEKRRGENRPYAKLFDYIQQELFKVHPYKGSVIGEMDHLSSATLNDFAAFNKKFHVPNNAVLVIAGDINIEKTKTLIDQYFGEIKRGNIVTRNLPKEDPIKETIFKEAYDENIQIPLKILAYRTPSMKTRESRVLDMISTYLSGGQSSILYKKLVDKKKMALQVLAANNAQEDYGIYFIGGLPLGDTELSTLTIEIDEEIDKLKNELISERDFQKIQNKYESQYVSSNSTVEGIANSLARYHTLYGDIDLINNEIDIYRSISREEIQLVAKKYLNKNQRLELNYLPKK